MPAYFGITDHDLAVLDAGDIGRSAAHLKEQAICEFFVHQRAGNASRGAGEDGKNRAVADLVHSHNTAIAAHDHQRAFDSRCFDALIRHRGCLQHFGHDAGIDDRCTGTDLQAIQLGNVVGRGTGQPHILAQLHGAVFPGRIINAERLRRHKAGATMLFQGLQRGTDRGVNIRSGCVYIDIV